MRNVSYKVLEIAKTNFMINNFFPRKSFYLRDNGEIYGTAGQTIYDSIKQRMHFAC